MIIDCHGHYTTAPKALEDWRNRQIAGIKDPVGDAEGWRAEDQRRRAARVDRDQPAAADAGARHRPHDLQPARELHGAPHRRLRGLVDLGRDLQRALLPRSAGCSRTTSSPAAMLPQSPGVDPKTCIPELEKCVEEYGNVGINLNPDPSGGHWTSPPLTDRHWYPIYEKMVEYDIPAMIHVSTSCNPVLPHHRRALPERRHHRLHAVPDVATCSRTSRRCASSSRTAAARCRTTGAASAAWRRS